MGIVDSRLVKLLGMVKEGVSLPIIVETVRFPSSSDLQELSQFMRVSRSSSLVPQVYGFADSYGIQNVASLVFVSRVFYDEPVSRFQIELPVLPSISISREDTHIPVSESAEFIGAKLLHDVGITGKGVKIGVVDTGCNRTHPMLGDAVVKQINIASRHGAVDSDINDGNGHGSHVGSTVAGRRVTVDSRILGRKVMLEGVAPEADIVAVKVLDDAGSGQTSWVMEGIEEAVNEGCSVINLSLGSLFDGGGMSPDSKLVDAVVFGQGVLCVVAAGNSFVNFSIGSPGGAMGALTVGSGAIKVPAAGMVSTFSSKGTTTDGRIKPDVSAPGGNILGIKETIFAAASGILEKEAGERYIGLMGTSMATPHISGCLALLLQAGMMRDRFYVEDLIAMTSRYPHPKDVFSGWGMIDVKKAYDYVIKNEPLVPFSGIMKIAGAPLQPLAAMFPRPEESIESQVVRLPYMR